MAFQGDRMITQQMLDDLQELEKSVDDLWKDLQELEKSVDDLNLKKYCEGIINE